VGASTNFGFGFSNTTAGGFYLNEIGLSAATTIHGSGTFDPTAGFTLNTPTKDSGGYSLGTRMDPGQSFNWGNLFFHNGASTRSMLRWGSTPSTPCLRVAFRLWITASSSTYHRA